MFLWKIHKYDPVIPTSWIYTIPLSKSHRDMQIPKVFSPTSGSAVHLCLGIALYMLGPTKGSQTYRYRCGGQMVWFTKDHNKVWLLGVLVRTPGSLLFIWHITLPTMKSPGKLQKVEENSKENSMCACVFVSVCVWDLPGSTALALFASSGFEFIISAFVGCFVFTVCGSTYIYGSS